MIDTNLFEKAGEYIHKNCEADDFILRINREASHETRFAQNAITQHMAGTNYRVRLKVAYDNKTGSASMNQLDNASLKHLIDTAQQIAQINQPDPEYVSTETKSTLTDINNYSEDIAEISVENIVNNIRTCVSNAESKGAKVSGIAGKRLRDHYATTKNGFRGYDTSSVFLHSMTMKKDEIETKVSQGVKRLADFDLNDLIEQLNSQFDSLQKPEKMDAQRIPVILRPSAVMNLYLFLPMMMRMRDADEGVSPFTGQLGKRCFGDRFTLRSVVDDPSLIAPKFSNSGLPSESITWIDKGVIENFHTTRYYAKLKNLKPTFPFNFYIEGGDFSEQEMMDMVDHGLIINNFWYIRFVDLKRGELTGMTRDGVLYFENGRVKHTVNNFRWNEILHETAGRILALGESIPYNTNFRVPTMLIDDFNLVDTTSF